MSDEEYNKFHNLAETWKEDTLLISSINKIESNETSHIIDLIHTESIMQSLGIDLWAHKE